MRRQEIETLRAVEDRHWWYVVLHGLVLAELTQILRPGSRVLDAGCGTGGMLRHLRQREWDLAGIDAAPEAVRHCVDRGLACVQCGRVEVLPFGGASFDAVLSLDVLYHAGVDEGAALREMVRVLRPGGRLVVNVAAFECLRGAHDLAVCGARRYKRRQLSSLLEFHSLDVELIHYWNAWLFPPLWIWRLWSRRRHDGGDTASELQLPRAWLNRLLIGPAWLDAKICRHLKVPFGSSILAIARKPR